MGVEICFLNMKILQGIYPVEPQVAPLIDPIANFTVNLFAPLWFQAFFPSDAAPLLLEFMGKVKEFRK